VTGEGLERLVGFLADKVEEGKAGKESEARRQKAEVRTEP
jgi:hypothetical protein